MFPAAWTVSCGLAVLVGLLWRAQVPVTVPGVALVLERPLEQQDGPHVISLLPPESLELLAPAQAIHTREDTRALHRIGHIEEVRGEVMSPAEVARTFELREPQLCQLSGPAVVVLARLEPVSDAEPTHLDGASFPVEVVVGARPAHRLLFEAWSKG